MCVCFEAPLDFSQFSPYTYYFYCFVIANYVVYFCLCVCVVNLASKQYYYYYLHSK
jgi:hypothetical protein